MVQGSHLMNNIYSRKLVIFYSEFDFSGSKIYTFADLIK